MTTPTWLAGKTGYSALDPWTLVHVAFWVVAGANIRSLIRSWPPEFRVYVLASCVLGAVAWELFERFAELRWPRVFAHPESWWNSYVSDQIACVVGVLGVWVLFDRWE